MREMVGMMFTGILVLWMGIMSALTVAGLVWQCVKWGRKTRGK